LVAFVGDGLIGFALLSFDVLLFLLFGFDELAVILRENFLEFERVFTLEVV